MVPQLAPSALDLCARLAMISSAWCKPSKLERCGVQCCCSRLVWRGCAAVKRLVGCSTIGWLADARRCVSGAVPQITKRYYICHVPIATYGSKSIPSRPQIESLFDPRSTPDRTQIETQTDLKITQKHPSRSPKLIPNSAQDQTEKHC